MKAEYGEDFALYSFLGKGLAVHHAGISPEVRTLLEWLTEEGELAALVATTTLAQGVNFPISNVVLSTHFKAMRVGETFIKATSDGAGISLAAAGRCSDTLGLVILHLNKQTTLLWKRM